MSYRPCGRSRRIWVYNIRMYLGETGWEVVDWIYLDQDRVQWLALVNTVINLQVAKEAGNFLTI